MSAQRGLSNPRCDAESLSVRGGHMAAFERILERKGLDFGVTKVNGGAGAIISARLVRKYRVSQKRVGMASIDGARQRKERRCGGSGDRALGCRLCGRRSCPKARGAPYGTVTAAAAMQGSKASTAWKSSDEEDADDDVAVGDYGDDEAADAAATAAALTAALAQRKTDLENEFKRSSRANAQRYRTSTGTPSTKHCTSNWSCRRWARRLSLWTFGTWTWVRPWCTSSPT
jgi:hypothetical protein